MNHIIRITLISALLLSNSICFGQSLKNEIDNIYNFKPSKLSQSEQESKIPAIDKFWNKIKSDTGLYLPALRNELANSAHNPYFYFDGTALLLSLSHNALDKQLGANAIFRCDLEDINRRAYVRTLNQLANEGANVTKAALKILRDTGYSFFVPQHVLTFDQSLCLTYMLVPENPKFYVDSLISYFKNVDTIAQRSILTTFWFAYSCKGDSLIKEIINDKSFNKSVRNIAKDMMMHENFSKDENDYIEKASQAELAELRKKSLQRFSDEALSELALTTMAMRKNDLCH